MKKILLGSAALLALFAVAPAGAADMAAAPAYKAPPPPVFTWTGIYGGVHAGGIWGEKHWYNQFAGAPAFLGFDVGNHHVRGGLAGGQVGFNYQIGSWVVGLEAQGSWASATGDNTNLIFSFTGNGDRIINNSEVRSIGVVAGRVGYAFDRVLPYVIGGGAWANDKFFNTTTTSPLVVATGTDTRSGWMAGVGVEYAFWDNLSLKLEYNYLDLGRERIRLGCPGCAGGAVDYDIVQQMNTVKLGLNYRFGGYGPVYAKY
jgi:outer membrane immunogenic protein